MYENECTSYYCFWGPEMGALKEIKNNEYMYQKRMNISLS